jgi:pyrrolidone-carboxylate peptidase
MHPTPSIILHIGLAAGRDYYTLEKGSFSRGYGAIPDVDGKKFSEEAAEELFPRSLYPNTLQTSFDTADVLVRWKQNLSSPTASFPDVRNSPDGGNFMCGFIYWNSLAHYYSINEHGERPVVFLHVPDLSESPEQIEVGVGVAVALIKALVESRRKVGFVDGWVNVGKGSEGEEDARAATDNNFV